MQCTITCSGLRRSVVDNVHYRAGPGADQGALSGVSAEGSDSCADQRTGNRRTSADRDEAQRENYEWEESSHRALTLSDRRIGELLTTDAGLVHQPALCHRERRHAVVIRPDRLGIILPHAGGSR